MTTTQTADRQAVQRERDSHHDALEALAKSVNPKNKTTGFNLWRKLRRIEDKASKQSVRHCNGEIDGGQWETAKGAVEFEVKNVFGGTLPPGFFVNGDPRGYALKLAGSDDGSKPATPFDLHKDWGGYQILAPEIN